MIFEDLKTLSGGRITVPESLRLSDSRDILAKAKKKRQPRKK
jgi:hypothetical protein